MDSRSASLHDRFQHLHAVISSDRFLRMEGIGNEVPFFICPYSPHEENEMRQTQNQLIKKLKNENHLEVLSINLYDLCLRMLKKRDLWDRLLAMEEELSKDEMLEILTGVLDVKSNLVPEIVTLIKQNDPDVLFVSGMGEVYPYIRTHSLLDNLQSVAKSFPSVFFFPGTYTFSIDRGSYLKLFDKLNSYSYYRAFNIFHYEI